MSISILSIPIRLKERELDRTERLFAHYGPAFVLFGRFIPLIRSFVGVVAGLGRMAIVPYTLFTAIAVAIWCTALAALGDVLGRQWNQLSRYFGALGYSVLGPVALSGLVLGAIWVHRVRSAKRSLAAIPSAPVAADAVSAQVEGMEPRASR